MDGELGTPVSCYKWGCTTHVWIHIICIYIYNCMYVVYLYDIYILHIYLFIYLFVCLFIYVYPYPVCIQCILHTVLSEIGYVLKTTLTCLFLQSMEGFADITAGSGYCWNTTGARYLHDIESFERPIDHDLFPLFVFASKPVTSIWKMLSHMP